MLNRVQETSQPQFSSEESAELKTDEKLNMDCQESQIMSCEVSHQSVSERELN